MTATAVRLRITSADADPVLRFFGLYLGAWAEQQSKTREGELTGLRVEAAEGGVTVDFGGIFPFDRVYWEAPAYQIYAFNGASYDFVTEGNGTLTFPAITGAYKIKLLVTAGSVPETSPRVFLGSPE